MLIYIRWRSDLEATILPPSMDSTYYYINCTSSADKAHEALSMHLWKHKFCSRGYNSYAQGSLLFKPLTGLQLFNSCRSFISFLQDTSIQETSFGLGSSAHVGSSSSQCLAEQTGLISSLAQNNSQYLTKYCVCLPFICLLLAVTCFPLNSLSKL